MDRFSKSLVFAVSVYHASAARMNRVNPKHRKSRRAAAGPVSDVQTEIGTLKHDLIACPVIAAMVDADMLTPDKYGRVEQNALIKGMMMTGNSQPMSYFQAAGIAGFLEKDVHAEKRIRGPDAANKTLFLNLYIMNRGDTCDKAKNRPNLPTGLPCNANVGFQQHGYSTTIRDPDAGGDVESRFNEWFEKPGVLTKIAGVEGRVMTLAGLGALLKSAIAEGEYSGEFSNDYGKTGTKGLSVYHPSATSAHNRSTLSQWQGTSAWGSFFAAFAYKMGGQRVIPEADLRTFFLEGRFPETYKVQPWGFKDNWNAIIGMSGMGAGEEWIQTLNGFKQKLTAKASGDVSAITETDYLYGTLGAISVSGGRDDDINLPYPCESSAMVEVDKPKKKAKGGKRAKGGKKAKGKKKNKVGKKADC